MQSTVGLIAGYSSSSSFKLYGGFWREMTAADTTPPASITNPYNTTYATTSINWTWTDPADADFAKVKVYLNGVFKTDVNKGTRFYLATGLTPNTAYTIGTHTVDTSVTSTRPG